MKKIVALPLLLVALAAPFHAATAGGMPPGSGAPDDLSPGAVRTQLHIHSLSNHNGARRPASVQWHVAQAAALPGNDFIWWTDHGEIFNETPSRRVFTLAFRDFRHSDSGSRLEFVSDRRVLRRILSSWRYEVEGGAFVTLAGESARLDLPPGGDPARITLEPESGRGRIHLNWFTRPIAFRPTVRLVFGRLEIPPGARIECRCYLSYRLDARPVEPCLDFLITGRADHDSLRSNEREAVFIPVPLPLPVSSADSTVTVDLDLFAAVRSRPDLLGHTISTIELFAENGTSDSMCIVFDRMEVEIPPLGVKRFSEIAREVYAEVGEKYGVGEIMGAEIRFPGRKEHFCVYMPEPVPTAWLGVLAVEQRDSLLASIHARRGIYSLAHSLGTISTSHGRTPTPRKRATARKQAFHRLVEKSVFGADLFEVGYWSRGAGLLEDYLLLWDALAAAGHPMVGIGVTDSHGSTWTHGTTTTNTWATWIDGPPDPASMIDSLRAGRCYFGDMARWDGTLDLSLDNTRMGGTVSLRKGTHHVTVHLFPEEEELEVTLTVLPLNQEIESPDDVRYNLRDKVIAPNEPVAIELRESSLVRAAVRRVAEGEEPRTVALTNAVRAILE